MARTITIFLIIFIDLIGFGIVLPMLPLYAEHFGASNLFIGIIVASFSIMQIFFSPLWGRLSDRIGRRPVILISVCGGTISYFLFALGSTMEGNYALTLILISRIFAGMCGGNVNVTQAYIADVTPISQRAAGMGIVGMAFSLGLIFGPVIGAFSSHWGIAMPPAIATGLSAISLTLAFLILKESLPPERRKKPADKPILNRFSPHIPIAWKHAFTHPQISILCVFFFISTFCFACYEVTMGLLAEHNLKCDTSHVAYFFAYHGLVAALMQGVILRPLINKCGEGRILMISFVGSAAALFIIPWFHSIPLFLVAITVNSIAVSLNRPTTQGLISRYAPVDQQGEMLGVAQSMSGIARIVSPLCCSMLFGIVPFIPYVFCGIIAISTAFFAYLFVHKRPTNTKEEPV